MDAVLAGLILLSFLFAPGLVAGTFAAGDCTADCYVDAVAGDDGAHHGTSAADAFQTIQKAIDTVATGGTVHVAPGLYAANFTEVSRSVALLGAQAGVDPSTRDASDAASESIVQSNTGFRVSGLSAQVTIDGFVFKEKSAGLSIGISTGAGISDVGATVSITNDIFSAMNIGIGSVFGTNASSLAISRNLFDGGASGVLVQGDRGAATLAIDANRFQSITGSAVHVLVWSGATITGNTVQSQTGVHDPILVGGCTSCTIGGNTIADSAGFESISLIGSNGDSVDGTIENNSITNPTRPDNYGIYIGLATGTTIRGNSISGAREAGIASDPASTIVDNTVTSAGGANTTGIYLRGASTGSMVKGNSVSGANVGIDVDPQAGSADTHIGRNAIVGNGTGLRNRAPTLADAACNWWGDPSGPAGQGPGSGDPVSANVTFSPWLIGSDLATAACGVPPTPTPSATPAPTHTAIAEICDNCIDDDGDLLVDRDDPDCPARADGLGAGLAGAARAKAVVKCQKALGTAATSFALKKQKILVGCIAKVQKCLQLKPAQSTCIPKARATCAKSVAKIAGLETKLEAGVRKACGSPLVLADLTAVAGLGFAAEASACSDIGVATLDSAADVALCLVRRHECAVERLLWVEAPRARELLALDAVDLSGFGCIAAGVDGGAQGLGDVGRGKALTKCEGAIEKSAATFVKQQTGSFKSCIDAVTKCVQQKPNDPKCLPKAQASCAKLRAKLAGPKGPAAKTRAAIVKACSGDPSDLLATTGLGHEGVATYCSAIGVPTLASATDVAECLVRDHRCRVGQLLDASMPRATELLSRGGLTP